MGVIGVVEDEEEEAEVAAAEGSGFELAGLRGGRGAIGGSCELVRGDLREDFFSASRVLGEEKEREEGLFWSFISTGAAAAAAAVLFGVPIIF